MPIVSVKVLAGAFSKQQKEQLIDGITDIFAAVGGEGIRPNVAVLVEEIESGMWGIGGHKLTIGEIEERRSQRGDGSLA